jgi:hypothetical protein
MNRSWRVLVGVAVVAASAAVAVYASRDLRRKRDLADLTVDQIEEQIIALDPITRAAVIARLSTDAAKVARDRVSH